MDGFLFAIGNYTEFPMKLLVIYIVNLPILRSKYRYTKIYCKENEKKLILILCIGKGEDKFGSDPFGTDDINIFMVCMNDFFYNGKTKSGAFFIFSTGSICLIKAFPDTSDAIFWNTDAAIFDGYKYFSISKCSFNCDDRICIAKFKSIVDQIVHNLINFGRVCFDVQFISGQDQVKRKTFFFAAPLKHQYRSFDELIQIKYSQIQVRAFGTVFV